jgi:hypothetical protein
VKAKTITAAAAGVLLLPAAAYAHDKHDAIPSASCVSPGVGTADVNFNLSPDLTAVQVVAHVRVDDGPVADFDQRIGPGRSLHVDAHFSDAGVHTTRIIVDLIDTQFTPGKTLDHQDKSFTFTCAPLPAPVETAPVSAPPVAAPTTFVTPPGHTPPSSLTRKAERKHRVAKRKRQHARERRMERHARHRATAHRRPRSTG